MDWLKNCVCGSRATEAGDGKKKRKKIKKQSKRKKVSEKYLEDTKSFEETTGDVVNRNRNEHIEENVFEDKCIGDIQANYSKSDDKTVDKISENVFLPCNESRNCEKHPEGFAVNTSWSSASRRSEKLSPVANGGCRSLKQSMKYKTPEEKTLIGLQQKRISVPKQFQDSVGTTENKIHFEEPVDRLEESLFDSRNFENNLSFRGRNKFGYAQPSHGGAGNDREFRMNSNSCSFVIPVSPGSKKKRRIVKRIGSQIPQPSMKQRGSREAAEKVEDVKKNNKNGTLWYSLF